MATYNGARYIADQIDSILAQLGPADEIVVVDDASSDGTADLVAQLGDPRVRVYRHDHNVGYVRTFEEALMRATGEHLLLSDQDDVWTGDHVAALVHAVGTGVAATNLAILGGSGKLRGPLAQRDWRLRQEDSRRPVRNLLGILAGNRPYFGCAMALHRSFTEVVLPFPVFLYESHDLWIAICGNTAHQMRHVPTRAVLRRLHSDNASPSRPRGVLAVVRSRLLVARMIAEAHRRVRSGHQWSAGPPRGTT